MDYILASSSRSKQICLAWMKNAEQSKLTIVRFVRIVHMVIFFTLDLYLSHFTHTLSLYNYLSIA